MTLRVIGSNQTEVSTDSARILFSYNTPVAARVDGQYYRTSKAWSSTTSKHINKWLAGAHAETQPQEYFDNLGK